MEQNTGSTETVDTEAKDTGDRTADALDRNADRIQQLLSDIFGAPREERREPTNEELEKIKANQRRLGQAFEEIGYRIQFKGALDNHRQTTRIVDDIHRLATMIMDGMVCEECLSDILDRQ